MSGASTRGDGWLALLEPATRPEGLPDRPDDPRLGHVVLAGRDVGPHLGGGRPALVGFPVDEGVRRNGGRPGAALAPARIRHWLYRLTPQDLAADVDLSSLGLLDLGDVRPGSTLEEGQEALAEVVAGLLRQGGFPIILGGGHETALGHYLGHARAGQEVAVLNVDAHLDVRPLLAGLGHSGSPFRQALEHPDHPLSGPRYVCLGAQPQAVAREHHQYVVGRGGRVYFAAQVQGALTSHFEEQVARLAGPRCRLMVTLDADVARTADVPGVSAPAPCGLSGGEVARWARAAGASPEVASFDLVEINPAVDRDDQSSRWAALVVWHFLCGLAARA